MHRYRGCLSQGRQRRQGNASSKVGSPGANIDSSDDLDSLPRTGAFHGHRGFGSAKRLRAKNSWRRFDSGAQPDRVLRPHADERDLQSLSRPAARRDSPSAELTARSSTRVLKNGATRNLARDRWLFLNSQVLEFLIRSITHHAARLFRNDENCFALVLIIAVCEHIDEFLS